MAGVQPAPGQVGRQHRHDDRRAVNHRAQDHRYAVQFLLEIVAHDAHSFGAGRGGGGDHQFHPVHFLDAGQQGFRFRAPGGAFRFVQAAAQPVAVGDPVVQAGFQVRLRNLQLAGQGLQRSGLPDQQILGGASGHRFDAPRPAADAGLAQDRHDADFAGGPDVGAAADLHAEGRLSPASVYADHPRYVADAVAEKGQRALPFRFGVGGFMGGHGQVGADLSVDQGLNIQQLVGSQGGGVVEIKAQPHPDRSWRRPAARDCPARNARRRATYGWRCGCARWRRDATD